MKRLPFERAEVHYDDRLTEIDEQICALLKKRKDISNDNPGSPKDELIVEWADKFGFYEEFLNVIFETFRSENHFKPRVEPEGLRKNLLVHNTVDINNVLYSVNFIRQYKNASVINLTIDWNSSSEEMEEKWFHSYWKLDISDEYDCRTEGGGGSGDHMSYKFVVSPALPDDPTGLTLQFKGYQTPHQEGLTEVEFDVKL